MKVHRENKKLHSYYISLTTAAIIKTMSFEDGCSENETLTLAVHYYQQYRNMLLTMAGMQKDTITSGGDKITLLGESLKRDLGVYQVTVDKCNALMDKGSFDKSRDKRAMVRLMETCNYHLENDLCTQEEREVFTKFIDWAQDKLEELNNSEGE